MPNDRDPANGWREVDPQQIEWQPMDPVPIARGELPPRIRFGERAAPPRKKKEAPEGIIHPDSLPEGFVTRGLPPFKPKYDLGAAEVGMRLKNCIVAIKGLPYVVLSAVDLPDEGVAVKVMDPTGQTLFVNYNEAPFDLRCIGPRYIQHGAVAGYVTRLPVRHVQQGIHAENYQVCRFGDGQHVGVDTVALMRALSVVDIEPYSNAISAKIRYGMVHGYRLSNNVAVGLSNKDIGVEYKGRPLGIIRDGKVQLDELDKEMSWLHKDLNEVHLEAA
jgi:hypothetical protein